MQHERFGTPGWHEQRLHTVKDQNNKQWGRCVDVVQRAWRECAMAPAWRRDPGRFAFAAMSRSLRKLAQLEAHGARQRTSSAKQADFSSFLVDAPKSAL